MSNACMRVFVCTVLVLSGCAQRCLADPVVLSEREAACVAGAGVCLEDYICGYDQDPQAQSDHCAGYEGVKCSDYGGGGCLNIEPNQLWYCEEEAGETCRKGNYPCGLKRYCDSDQGSCNYGDPDWQNWFCYNPNATCGAWMVTQDYDSQACHAQGWGD